MVFPHNILSFIVLICMVLKEYSHHRHIYTLMQMQSLNLILRVLVSVDQKIDFMQFLQEGSI